MGELKARNDGARNASIWRMGRFLLILMAGTASASQYYATNQNGSVLYFSSSLRLKGTTQYFHPKLFVWEQGKGVRLYEQRASDLPVSALQQGFMGSQYFQLERVDDSSDNSTVAVLGERVCTAIGCAQMERYQTTVHIAGRADVVLPGDPVLSRNGRYVLLSSSIRPDFIADRSGIVTVLLVDLATGKQTPYRAWAFGSPVGQQVADDGTVLLSSPSGLALGRDGQLTSLGIGGSYGLINAAGTSVLYSPYYYGSPLYAYTVAGGNSTLLAQDFAGFSFVIASDDGSAIAYAVSAPPNTWQIWFVRSDGSGRRQLTSFPEGASPVAISGDGKIVFARTGNDATGNNRIVRIDVASGQQTEIVPAMPGPFYSSIMLQTVRGGLAQFGWLGLHLTTSSAPPPLPLSFAGLTVRVAGVPVPIASVEDGGSFWFQVPWDLPDGFTDMVVEGPYLDAGLFAVGASLAPAPPGFYTMRDTSSAIIVAVHQDFASLVREANRAQAGEILHVYAQNLGTTSAPPAMGQAAPVTPLSTLAAGVACVVNFPANGSGASADVLFAGLAPGMFGVYQLDLRLPELAGSGWATVTCHVGSVAEGFDLTGYLPFQAAN